MHQNTLNHKNQEAINYVTSSSTMVITEACYQFKDKETSSC